jgi:hypothetical protein
MNGQKNRGLYYDGMDIYLVNNTEEILKMLEKPLEACKYCDRSSVMDLK